MHILRNGILVDIDNPANRSHYAPNVTPACCTRCGLSWLADVRWHRVDSKLICENCKESEATK